MKHREAGDSFNVAALGPSVRESIQDFLLDLNKAQDELAIRNAVPAPVLSKLINEAENLRLIDRQGLNKSGGRYVEHEAKMLEKNTDVAPDFCQPVIDHLRKRATRAINCLDNPNGYKMPDQPLYGTSGLIYLSFKPLIP